MIDPGDRASHCQVPAARKMASHGHKAARDSADEGKKNGTKRTDKVVLHECVCTTACICIDIQTDVSAYSGACDLIHQALISDWRCDVGAAAE